MSYVARTFSHTERGTIQMVNVGCVTEALKMNGYTNIKVGNTISFRHNNRTYSTSRLRNGIITITTNNRNEVQYISDLVKDIEKSYKKAVKIREERLRKEREEAERWVGPAPARRCPSPRRARTCSPSRRSWRSSVRPGRSRRGPARSTRGAPASRRTSTPRIR